MPETQTFDDLGSVIVFDHDDKGFEDWVSANQAGYVLNFRRGYGTLHHSNCPHLRMSVGQTSTGYRPKMCAHSEAALARWATDKGHKPPVWCQTCSALRETAPAKVF